MKQLPPEYPVGLFFYACSPNGRVSWRGEVVARSCHGFYMVQLDDLFNNSDSPPYDVLKLVRAEQMQDWNFYTSHEHMIDAIKRHEGDDEDEDDEVGSTGEP